MNKKAKMKYGMGGMAKYKKGRGVIKAKGGGCMSKKMRPAKYV